MRIGLTYTGSDEKHNNYVHWLKDGQADIEVVKLSLDGGGVSDYDALVLSGGIDIHPSFYGGGMDYDHRPGEWQEGRDEFEKNVLERAWERRIPVLGVCRGLQLINVCCGGTLVQDLGPQGDLRHQNTPADKEHDVKVMEGTLLHEVSGGGGWINSAHHQAIDRLGKGLVVNCHADDGVIEGVEWAHPEGRAFMLAVQWHPERMYVRGYKDLGFYKAVRDRFIEEIKKQL
ncbi:MAG: gamma-glutamyl-gamma-aminobutyrate hydrolase family protein [Chitinophagaceae bacterium]|nr:gamma-glutamyl-gamma-aminobutyrate hydrolase family protein [Chitinophagaceae bacterium]